MGVQSSRLFGLLVLTVLFSAACPTREAPSAPPVEQLYFPPSEACLYTVNAPIKTFKNLAGGTWSRSNATDPNSPFECVGAKPSVQLFNNEIGLVEIRYFASGVEKGASMISLDYSVQGKSPIPNESTYRNVFANLVEMISKQALGTAPPELFRRKISNLSSFSETGKGSAENFDVGPGFVSLSRETSVDRSSIDIKVMLYPDIGLKLQN